tara:strand:- start:17483 stop:17908 length:426 start_codon:yes stop_codon:yes gene_type:complete
MKRGDIQLKRSPLNKRSTKMKDKYVERRALVKDLLSERPFCEACLIFASKDGKHSMVGINHSMDIHELVNRSQGGSILELNNLLAVCRLCHTRITVNPKEAELLGLHLESWCNTDQHLQEAERVRNDWKNGDATKPYWFSG